MSELSLDRLCIHQVTLMQCDFRASIECLARNGVRKTAVWRDKLEEVGISEACKILRGEGMEVVSLCAGGFLTDPDPAGFDQSIEANRRWIEQAAAIGARSLVTITGGLVEGSNDLQAARDRAVEGLERLVPTARAAGVRLALEPLHPMVCGLRSVISELAEANRILDLLDCEDVMGIALDTYALWWDASLQSQIASSGKRIINLHVSDWLRDTRDLRLDRGMPGDGIIDNRMVRSWIEHCGFSGPVEVEIFSQRHWWMQQPDDVVQTIIERSRRYL